MRTPPTPPSGVERHLATEDVIVTKTDTRGILRYANETFLRISALTEQDALGQPHNIIRHPDMPRSVFQHLWDTISGGHELFAYVLNLARDGAHYWVLAHVTPSRDRSGRLVGYHSNRRCPDPAAVAAATDLYARLVREERRHPDTRTAVRAGTDLLHRELAENNLTFDELVWSWTDEVAA